MASDWPDLDGWMCDAAEAGDVGWIEDLLAGGANPNARVAGRGSAVELARKGGHVAVVEAVRTAGADDSEA